MKSLSRRELLRNSTLWTSGVLVSGWGLHRLWRDSLTDLPLQHGSLRTGHNFYGASYKRQTAFPYDLGTSEAFAFRINEEGEGLQYFPISVPAHSVNPFPHDPNRALAISSRVGAASIIDWREGKEISRLELPSNELMQGHAVFRQTAGGSPTALISASQHRGLRMFNGRLIEVELESLEVVRSHPLQFGSPHEMLSLDQDHVTLGVAGLSKIGARFAVYDLVNGKLEMLPSVFDVDPWRGMVHFVFADDVTTEKPANKLPRLSIWSSNTRINQKLADPALVFFDLQSLRADRFMFPEELRKSELLSMVYHPETGHLWGTLPDLNKAFVFDVDSRRLVKVLDFPYRVTYAGRGQAKPSRVILGGGDRFSIWDPERLQKLDEQPRLAALSPSEEFHIAHLR